VGKFHIGSGEINTQLSSNSIESISLPIEPIREIVYVDREVIIEKPVIETVEKIVEVIVEKPIKEIEYVIPPYVIRQINENEQINLAREKNFNEKLKVYSDELEVQGQTLVSLRRRQAISKTRKQSLLKKIRKEKLKAKTTLATLKIVCVLSPLLILLAYFRH